jgi:hypothetical protein
MVNAVAAGARDPPLQADDLGDEPIMARQGDVARVEQRQHVPEQIRLGPLAQFVADAVLAEWLLHELAAVVVTNYTPDRAVRFDLENNPVDFFPRAYFPGEVTLRLGNRKMSADEFKRLAYIIVKGGLV